jgi:thiamine-monophosphate kinase
MTSGRKREHPFPSQRLRGLKSSSLKEYQLIQRLTSPFRRSPAQLNPVFGSDSELVRLLECGEVVVALTTDGIVEEIDQGLYVDPFLVGWMTVMVNLSDLAAVGARAEGVLIQLNLPPRPNESLLSGLRRGIEAACRECATYVLGGDVNSSTRLSTAGTAFGVVPASRIISRIGCRSGDRLYTSSSPGLGTAFAFQQIFTDEGAGIEYRPTARLDEGRVVREFASACLDTSDGLIPGLAQLEFVNDVGFELAAPCDQILHPAAKELARQTGLPPWFFLAGPHGDFELVFTVPVESEAKFLEAAKGIGWKPLWLGEVVPRGLSLDLGTGELVQTDAALIANLFENSVGDSAGYLESLKAFHRSLMQGK